MDLKTWGLYSLTAALLLGGAVLHYHRREPGGRRRLALGVVRGAVLALLALLLFDPVVPVAPTDGPVVALVDASLSMGLPTAAGSRWEEAREVVEEVGPDRVLLFGTGEARRVESLDGVEPDGIESRLDPALRAAVESGAGRILVVTDGGIEDEAEAMGSARSGGGSIEVRTVGGPDPDNLALAAVEAPRWLEAGVEGTLDFELTRLGDAGGVPDTVEVVARLDGRTVGRTRMAAPRAGRRAEGSLPLRLDGGGPGPVRVDVELRPGGSAEDDDVRSVYVRVAEEPPGVVLVSARPDQEPRFLVPVLERALAVPVRGWLVLPGERYIRVGAGRAAGERTDAAAVRRAVDEAGLVILHGLGGPAWLAERAGGVERILLFADDVGPAGVDLEVGSARAGDWYPAEALPSSPVAPLLAGLDVSGLPPLTALRPVDDAGAWWAPLQARLGRRGEPEPVLLAGSTRGRRVAIALGDGYWRWAFSGDGGRMAYARFWSAVVGWLMEDVDRRSGEAIRPEPRVVPRGAPLRWVAPPGVDSLRLTLTAAEGSAGVDPTAAGRAPGVARDTMVAVEGGVAVADPLPPGHYAYRAAVPGSGETAEGRLTVESYTPELTRPPVALGPGSSEDSSVEPGRGRPLHATPWPYIALVLLLCGEWVARRRWGLR